MPSNTQAPNRVRGWILDAYPAGEGEIAVWIISESGERVRLTDKFQPRIYVSAEQDEIERLPSRLYNSQIIASWRFAEKYAHPTDSNKSRVLELTLKDCRRTQALTRNILKMGDYLRYEIHNCDLKGDRAYFYSHDIFPLAYLEVKTEKTGLSYTLQDSVESTDYVVPELRVTNLKVDIAKKGKIANFNDPIDTIQLTQEDRETCIDSGDETDKLVQLVKAIKALDPDIVVTSGGDSYLFPYLTQRATVNNLSNEFTISRDDTPFPSKAPCHAWRGVLWMAARMKLSGQGRGGNE